VMPSSHSGWLAAVKPENIVTSTWLTAGNLPALRVRQRLPRADAPSRSLGPVRIARSFWSLPNRTAALDRGFAPQSRRRLSYFPIARIPTETKVAGARISGYGVLGAPDVSHAVSDQPSTQSAA
jgi:hypothetical protein